MKKPRTLLTGLLALSLCLFPFTAIADAEGNLEIESETNIEEPATPPATLEPNTQEQEGEELTSNGTESTENQVGPTNPTNSMDPANSSEPKNEVKATPTVAPEDDTELDSIPSPNALEMTEPQAESEDLPESWKDPNPPVFGGASLNGTVFSVGDVMTFALNISDKDGIKWIDAIVQREDDYASYSTWYLSGSESGTKGQYQVTSNDNPGIYKVVGFEVFDKAGYYTNIYDRNYAAGNDYIANMRNVVLADLPNLSFEIKDTSDSNPPVFGGASLNGTVFSVGDVMTFALNISDKDGIKWIDAIVQREDDYASYSTWYLSGSESGTKGQRQVTSNDKPGMYKVIGFMVADNAGYYTYIYDRAFVAENESVVNQSNPVVLADLPNISFEIKESNDPNPPVFASASLNGTVFSVGDIMTFALNITDKDGIEYISAIVQRESDDAPYTSQWYLSGSGSGSQGQRQVTSNDNPGIYKVVGFEVFDKAGYYTNIYDRNYAAGNDYIANERNVVLADLPNLPLLLDDKTKENYYKVLEGNNAVIKKGAAQDLSVRFDGDLDKFVVATMDGATIDPSNYTLKSGSTIITLSKDYLNSLAPGTHTLAAWYEDGGNGLATLFIEGDPNDNTAAGITDNEGGDQLVSNDPTKNNTLVSTNAAGSKLAQTGDTTTQTLTLFALAIVAVASLTLASHRKLTRGKHRK